MCGIAGAYNFEGAPADPAVLRRMIHLLRHRGPDAQGQICFSLRTGRHSENGIGSGGPFEGGLGVTRLRIRELSSQADQPYRAPEAPIWVAFNGEIYNAREHRTDLRAEGVSFHGRSDTEVVLQLYRRHGFEALLELLQGMFALAVVDLRLRRLYLARDRFGIKPLYWCQSPGGTLLFASEIKAFLVHPEFQPDPDLERLDEFILFRYCVGKAGLLRGVRRLCPGGWMEVGVDRRADRSYGGFPPGRRPEARSGASVKRLEQELRAAVKRQLIGDVPIGCQLSGGVDSSLVAWSAAQERQPEVHAFSVIPDHPAHSEARWIDQSLRVTGLVGRRFVLDADRALGQMHRATWHLDHPLTHPNSLGLMMMAERAGRHVRVLLSGEGADELMGGYTRSLYASLLPWIRAALPWAGWAPGRGEMLRDRFTPAVTDPEGWYLLESAFLTIPQLMRLRSPQSLENGLRPRRELFGELEGEFLQRTLQYEMQTYLPDLLMRQDKMGMAHAVEVRIPFLDDSLADFCLGLPEHLLVGRRPALGHFRAANTKVLLKRLAADVFGASFAYRPKGGFSLPIAEFMRHPKFREWVEYGVLPAIGQRDWVRPAPVNAWWKRLQEGDDEPQEALWICIALEVWAQEFLDGRWKSAVSAPQELEPTHAGKS